MLNLPGRHGCYARLHLPPLPRHSLHMCIAGYNYICSTCFASHARTNVQPRNGSESNRAPRITALSRSVRRNICIAKCPSSDPGSAHAGTGVRTLIGRFSVVLLGIAMSSLTTCTLAGVSIRNERILRNRELRCISILHTKLPRPLPLLRASYS